MRNYIILNGQNSNEITGLLIQSLPPISQPKIRTNIEEIDGRDGDIITKLGYSAYNKEITIGLYGDYDVDQVIAYFTNNQNGKVTFSNEEDKYYNYEILEQIDFERLQTLPDGYTSVLPIKKAVFGIGNGWTVDVIAHIFKGLKEA